MLDDPWRRENRDSSAFTHYEISFGTRYRTAMVYAVRKTASNAKINHKMISFTTDHYSFISIYKNQKLKLTLEKTHKKLKLRK